MTLILIIMLACAAITVAAILHCPLARAIGLSMESFAEAARSEPDILR